MHETIRVLFLGTANASRSRMAEVLLQARAGDRVSVRSAGIVASAINPLTARVLAESGLDLEPRASQALAELPPETHDLVITLGRTARPSCASPEPLSVAERQRLLGGMPTVLHWPIQDPTLGEGTGDELLAVFRTIRDQIAAHVDTLVDHGYLDTLARQRRLLAGVTNRLGDAIIVHDEYRTVFLVNDAFEQLTGLRRERIIGRDCHELFPDHGLCGGACQFPDGPDAVGDKREYPLDLHTDDGEIKRLLMRTMPLEIETGTHGMLGVIRDQTEMLDLRATALPRRVFHGMVGASPTIQEVFRSIESVSASDYPVLITGESGTGKELTAAAIHRESSRSKGPFVPINCGALPENILESELFGHVRGAFTGAIRDKKGRFELADGGTLFLDEVGELSPPVQVKLLRVLQEKRFERVGGEQSLSVDVRVVSATNRDLRAMMDTGTFREDLFYRLCVVPIELPPLRDRREDIPYLVEHILKRIRKETSKQITGLGGSALDVILAHNWPGNIRELVNALQFAAVRCDGDRIDAQHLPPEVRQPRVEVRATAAAANGGASPTGIIGPTAATHDIVPDPKPRSRLTTESVARALTVTDGNKVRAAQLLGVGRATLYRFFQKHGIPGEGPVD